MNARLTLPSAGCTTPAPPESMTDHTASGRPWELDDRAWLSRALATDGERSIAQQLGVSRGSVVRARLRLGISASGPGARRGASASTRPSASVQITDETERLILDRLRAHQARQVPATEGTLATAIRAAHEARTHRNPLAYEDALIDIAAAAGSLHRHQRRLRRAA